MNKDDPFNLHRFLVAQEQVYDDVIAEIRAGRKRTHWMWFIFPQFAGLGYSATSQHFAIRSLDEAKAYLAHPVLGRRLIECAEATRAIEGKSADDVFGHPDDLKLKSSATLFANVSAERSILHALLEKYFAGKADEKTLQLIDRAARNGTAS